MIITPNCQLFLDFQNNVVDNGHGGLTWTPQGNGAKYADGLIGRTYEFESPSNWLSAGNNGNAFGYTTEFTHIAVFKTGANGEMQVGDFGLRADFTAGNNQGLDFMFVQAQNVFFRIQQTSLQNFGAGFGRYRGSVTIPNQEWVFVACRRTNSRADAFYFFYESGSPELISEGVDFSGSAFNNWANRAWRIGARGTDAADGISNFNTDGFLNKGGVWTTALPDEDIRRLVSMMHPLNG